MATLHDRSERAEILQRLQSLRPDSRGRWGKMSVDQMLWHLAEAMNVALGRQAISRFGPPLPRAMVKFIVLRLPWFKGAPTHPTFVAKAKYDFGEQQARCLALVEAIAARSIDDAWPEHPAFGPMTGRDTSRLMAKHIDHHLRQFGA